MFGGGGFIGSNFYATYRDQFEQVIIVDRFHGASHSTLADFHRLRECLRPQDMLFTANAADAGDWPELLRGATDVFLLNADTGTGNSFDRPSRTIDENLSTLARQVEAIRTHCDKARTRVVFTSSRAVYGEGHWVCENHGVEVPRRTLATLTEGRFAAECPRCGQAMTLGGSLESDMHRPLSVYGMTKSAGEQLLTMTLAGSGFDVRMVRFQNVYGTGQAVDNPYTGVLNWFSRALLEGTPVKIFEEGRIYRDFIFVTDATALLHRLASADLPGREAGSAYVVNGGTGVATRLTDAAHVLREAYGVSTEIRETPDFRPGDVLGAVAAHHKAAVDLGFHAQVSLRDGLTQYASWFRAQ